jgi:hypothetical protein
MPFEVLKHHRACSVTILLLKVHTPVTCEPHQKSEGASVQEYKRIYRPMVSKTLI